MEPPPDLKSDADTEDFYYVRDLRLALVSAT